MTTPVFALPEITKNLIQGTNLLPGGVAGDDGSHWAVEAAMRASNDYRSTPGNSVEVINSYSLSERSGRKLHVRCGVWVAFCSHPECDAYVFLYGCYNHVPVMAQHEGTEHKVVSQPVLGGAVEPPVAPRLRG